MPEENLHLKHRSRLKKRFLTEGLENFEPHNILELVLFFSIPQGDTNETAHRLLNKFGKITDVFNADYERLLEVKGVGAHTAVLLKLIPELFSVYLKDKAYDYNRESLTVDKVAEYLVPLFVTCENEVVRALYFDNGMNLIEDVVIFEGDVNSARFPYRDIIKNAIFSNAPNIILSHNHPNGTPLPSMEDINTTRTLNNSLQMFGINLVEHIIVAGGKYTKIFDYLKKIEND